MHSNEYWLYIIISAGVILLGVTVLAAIFFVNKHDKANQASYLEKLNIDVSAMEFDRNRFAADLHDELGPTIAAVSFKLQAIESLSPEDEAIIASCVGHLSVIQRQIREISNGLMPQLLAKWGLVAAVQEFIYSFKDPGQLRINFMAEEGMTIPGSLDLHIYRIVLEIIHNCVKHSRAEVLSINIYRKDGLIMLVASDNGIGYDMQTARDSNGNGLRNIENRLALIKGTMEIKSTTGKGTLTIIGIPA